MELFKSKDGYVPLLVNLEGYWEKTLDQLPTELKAVIVDVSIFPNEWDGWDVAQRRWWATRKDYGNDPSREPALYFELYAFSEELTGWIEKARLESKDAAVVVLRDVADRIEKIFQVDREQVGTKIQKLCALDSNRDDAATTAKHAHISDKLTKMNQASVKFWANADRDDRATHPNNAKVAEWLVKQKFSETLAEKAATIIRPDWAPTGRKPDE